MSYRCFDVSIEDDVVLDDFDIYAEVGPNVGVMKSFVTVVSSDGNLDIDFMHAAAGNPTLSGIEVVLASENLGPDGTGGKVFRIGPVR